MTQELQGFGTYTYDCSKQDCWHCEHYGLKVSIPKLKLYPKVKNKLLPVKNRKKRYVIWRQSELDILVKHPLWTARELRPLLNRHKISTIATKRSRLRSAGYLI